MVNNWTILKILLTVLAVIFGLFKLWCLTTQLKTMTLEDETSNDPAVNRTEINSTTPKFKDLDRVDRVMVGYERKTIKLKCEAEGNPLLNITWYKDGVTPPQRQWGVIIYTQRAIILHNLTMEDSGTYKCKVINESRFIDFTYKVEVQKQFSGMIYIKEGNNITALVHTNASFNCNVEADQKPYIEWLYHNTSFKNVNDANLDDGIIVKDSNSSSNGFIITELFKLIDVTHLNEGWYTCKAILKNDTVYASAYLKVINTFEVPKNKVFKLKVYRSITMVISYELIILACVIMIVYRQKKKKKSMARKSDGNERIIQWTKKVIIEKLQITNVNEPLIKPVVNIKNKKSKSTNDHAALTKYELPIDHNFEFPRNKVFLGKTMGEGEFGKVVRGKINGIIVENGMNKVAVKMLKDGHTDSNMIDLVSEMEIMKVIDKHVNIINLLGCCSQDGPLYVIMEFALRGNLRDFLRHNSSPSNYKPGKSDDLTYNLREFDLLSFGYQVNQGMKYLSFRKCIHGDLAAKKVLVTDDLVMKISDFGLARDIQNQDYYRKTTDGRQPMKWMAPETLFFGLYTNQSDVWSFGVLLWEIITMGDTPYPTVPNAEQLFNLLQTGYRMEKPFYCSQEMYSIMQNCWNHNPNNRPKFNELMKSFDKILSETTNLEYIDLRVPQLDTSPPVNKIYSIEQPELNL